eukprot:333236-Prorocentrum_minimum.AAC.4
MFARAGHPGPGGGGAPPPHPAGQAADARALLRGHPREGTERARRRPQVKSSPCLSVKSPCPGLNPPLPLERARAHLPASQYTGVASGPNMDQSWVPDPACDTRSLAKTRATQ